MGHLIAFTLSVLLALMNAPNDQSRSMEKKAVPDVEFAHSGAIEGLTADGFEFSTEGYKSSDGISLSVTRIRCQTAETAERLMTQTLDNAKSVIRRDKLFDENGKQVGRRVIASFETQKASSTPAILWTNNNTFFKIDSPSIDHSLLLEENLFHNIIRREN